MDKNWKYAGLSENNLAHLNHIKLILNEFNQYTIYSPCRILSSIWTLLLGLPVLMLMMSIHMKKLLRPNHWVLQEIQRRKKAKSRSSKGSGKETLTAPLPPQLRVPRVSPVPLRVLLSFLGTPV